jgi:hypothetical protein
METVTECLAIVDRRLESAAALAMLLSPDNRAAVETVVAAAQLLRKVVEAVVREQHLENAGVLR